MISGFRKKPYEKLWHFTLSIVLEDQLGIDLDRFASLQQRLSERIAVSDSMAENRLYLTPLSELHFSLVDFMPARRYATDHDLARAKAQFEKIDPRVEQAESAVRDLVGIIRNTSITVEGAHQEGELDQVSLEAYPSEDVLSFAKQVASSVESEAEFPYVKGFPREDPKRFPINVLRMFREVSAEEARLLADRIVTIHREISANHIEFKLKTLSLVFSDHYLSNPDHLVAAVTLPN